MILEEYLDLGKVSLFQSESPLKRKRMNENALGHPAVTPTVAELHELTNLSSLHCLSSQLDISKDTLGEILLYTDP